MSWTSITKDGQKMWRSCDGEVLQSLEDVQALKDYRQQQYEERKQRDLENHLRWQSEEYDRWEQSHIEPITKEQKIFVGFILIVGVGFCLYKLIMMNF